MTGLRQGLTNICCALVLCISAGDLANASDGQVQYRVVPGKSEIRILVFRAGSLSRLGHNHVISTTNVSGSASQGNPDEERRIDLRIPVSSLIVDDPAARGEEGQAFAGEVSAKDAEATRDNMLGAKLLDEEQYDDIRIVSSRISGSRPDLTVHALITIKGEEHTLELPALVHQAGDGLVVSGTTKISHDELGLSPFSAAFGALRVADDMIVRYRIVFSTDGT
jgi:YceI-like domain